MRKPDLQRRSELACVHLESWLERQVGKISRQLQIPELEIEHGLLGLTERNRPSGHFKARTIDHRREQRLNENADLRGQVGNKRESDRQVLHLVQNAPHLVIELDTSVNELDVVDREMRSSSLFVAT